MPDLSNRSYEKELLDRNDLPFQDIKRNMEELEIINARLGGHKITILGLKELVNRESDTLSVCEIGCGGGDNLKAVYNWCRAKNIAVKLTGIDLNPDCIEYAKDNCKNIPAVEFIVSDYQFVSFKTDKPEIIFSSLFCHHLDDEQVVKMLGWSKQNSKTGFFINDLHRNPIAYYSIKFLTFLFSGSYLVKNDAPLSVKRGFKRKEIVACLTKAGIPGFSIKWKWAFRWLVIIRN